MTSPVRSFDIFDTLIARKALSPHAVFALAEERAAEPGFAARRVAVAHALAAAPCTLDDIYAELGRRHGYPAERLAALRALEVAIEFEQVLPIAGHLRQVRDGDLLLTDMYLPEATILQLLARAGLRRHVLLVRTAHGKASGEVWRGLAAGGVTARHLGDNAHSDVATARAAGHAADLTRAAGLTEVEDFLFRQGYCGTALLARSLRLSEAADDATDEALRLVQGQINAPLLIVAALQIQARLAAAGGRIDRVAFCSRDGAGWLSIFRGVQAALGGPPVASDYFFTSRLARCQAGADYADYARAVLGPSTLLVDLCGSGLSMQSFLDRHALPARALYLFKATAPRVLAHIAPLHPDATANRVEALIDNDRLADGTPMPGELMNLAEQGMVLDVRRVFGGFVPVLAEPGWPPAEHRRIGRMRRELDRAATGLGDPAFRPWFARRDALVPPERAAETLAALWGLAGRSQALHAAFAAQHLAEDQGIREHLQLPASTPTDR